MKTRYPIGCAILFTFFFNWVYGQESWKIDSTQVVFHISNAGFDVEGSIAGITGNIKFSKNKLGKSSFTATAKSETIQTGIKLRDKHLKKPDYFNVESYPAIKIKSKQINKLKDGFESISTITVKGQTKDIVITFTFKQIDNKATTVTILKTCLQSIRKKHILLLLLFTGLVAGGIIVRRIRENKIFPIHQAADVFLSHGAPHFEHLIKPLHLSDAQRGSDLTEAIVET